MAVAGLAVRSRRLPFLLSSNLPRFSTAATEPISTSAAPAGAADAAARDPASTAPPEASGTQRSPLWAALKFAGIASLVAVSGAVGYASYAYTLDEVDQKARDFRNKVKSSIADDASGIQKFSALAYSTVMQVPLKAVELYLDIRSQIEEQIRGFTEPTSDKLLPDLLPQEQHVFTIVLDLNETLVYSDWQRERGWRTFKRPGVDAFLEHLAKFYEIVVYSDQLSMYVDPVLDRLDQKGCVRFRLNRSATKYHDGKHYRDISKLNRNPSQVLYISGHALESSLQPENSVQIKPWKGDINDTELLDLIPFLEYVALNRPPDIRAVLASYQGCDIPSEFIKRSKEHQRRLEDQKQHGRFWRR